MAACCLLYLAWWCVFFWPRADGTEVPGALRAFGVVCILGAVACGAIAAFSISSGAGSLASAVPGWVIWSGGVVAYAILLWVTTLVFKRQPTTELMLFVAWTALELSAANGLAGSGAASGIVVGLVIALALVCLCASLVCYVRYYQLPAWPSFIDGCIPLVGIGIVSVVLALAL